MNLMTMGFKGFTWQVNPTTLRLELGRNLRETALPYVGSRLEDLGKRKRRVSGEGYFIGKDCMAQWQALGAAFAQGGPGWLQLPGQAPILAVMEELKLLGEPGENALRYSFAFVESTGGQGVPRGQLYHAAAGESLWDYAWRHHKSMEELRAANQHIRDIACLEQGEEVWVP